MNIARWHGLFLVPALALTACSSSADRTRGPATITATTAVSTPTTVATTTPGVQVATPARPASPGHCASSELRANLGPSRGAAGTSFTALLLTNRSRVTCTLDGYPGVSFATGPDAHQIGAAAQRDRRLRAAPVTLVPGATVHATVRVANYSNYDQQACQPTPATGYRIFPPGSTRSVLISAPQTVCSRPGVQSFQTSVVRAGSVPD